FMGALNSVVISVSPSEPSVKKSFSQVDLSASRNGHLNTQVTNGNFFEHY
ncbi:hypothetical protein PanWU01x14_176410, partial [Parasponia andersonii]